MKALLLVLVALLAGCALERPTGPVLISFEGDTVEELQATELAVREWVETCAEDVRIDPAGIPLTFTEEGIPEGKAGLTQLAGYEPRYIRVLPSAKALQRTIAHEIGHALQRDHLAPGKVGVMAEGKAGAAMHVTRDDCEAPLAEL